MFLHKAVTFVLRFNAVDCDAMKKEGETKLCPPVASVVGIVKKYKEIKKRCEPFTLGMLHLLF